MAVSDAQFDSLEVDGMEPGEESAPEVETAEELETPIDTEEPPKPPTPQTRYGSKIKELKNQAETAQAETKAERQARETAEAERDELRQKIAALPRVPEAAPSSGEFRFPTMEQWYRIAGNENKPSEAFYDERTDARYQWNAQQDSAIRYEQGLDARYQASLALVKAVYPDVDAVMAQNVDDTRAGKIPPLGVELRHAIRESEVSGLVAYHLASHPEEFASLNALRGRALVKAVAKLEGRLEAVNTGSASAAPTRSPKATPISPVGRGGADVPPESPPADDDDSPDIELTAAWVRSENKRQQERHGRR